MPRFHHLWIVEAEVGIANPAPDGSRAESVYDALARYASDDTDPYPASATRRDDGWLEILFPIWAPTPWAAIGAGAVVLSEACARAQAEIGVVRMAAAESSDELKGYRDRVQQMETR